MVGISWDGIYAKSESSPLDRFKNKNRILKSFGPDGVRVYEELDGARSARALQQACGLAPDLFERILTQLISDSAVHLVEPTPAPSASAQIEPAAPTAPRSSAPPTDEILPPPDWPPARPPTSRTAAPSIAPRAAPSAPPTASTRAPSTPASAPRMPSPSVYSPPVSMSSLSQPPAGASLTPPPASLSPLEKLIFEKYGQVGLKVYELIDGERTAEDILNETGLTESKLVEVLEFMNEQGIIKLDRPLRSPANPAAPGPAPGGGYGGAPGGPARPPMGMMPPIGSSASRPTGPSDDGVGFKPMVESDDDSTDGPLSPDTLPVDVPTLPARLSIIQKAQMAAILSTKYGKVGNDLLRHVDGNKDFVQLSLETGLSLRDLDIILGELGKSNLLAFKPLTRTEVRHRYGDDGLAIYKRFGRDGLLIYQMIGKVESLRDIVKKSQIEPQRAVDILIFVHRVLGLELPVDRDMIYRYLTQG